jgi:hypothetical protein
MGHFTAFLPVPAGVRHASVPQMGAPVSSDAFPRP